MSDPALVLLVDDHLMLAQSLALALRGHGLRAVVATVGDPAAVLAQVREHQPALVLLDLDLGPGPDGRRLVGEQLVPALRDLGVRVLVMTGTCDLPRIGLAVEAGALGWVDKSAPVDTVLTTVLDVVEGDDQALGAGLGAGRDAALAALARLRRGQSAAAARLSDFARLTDTEQEVLAALIQGSGVEAIAAGRMVSPTTVRSQVRGVLTKLGVSSQLAAVARAHRAGWRPPSR